MPKFIVDFEYEREPGLVSVGYEFSTDNEAFAREYLDFQDEVIEATDKLITVKQITAAEQISNDIGEGDVVWRDWYDCDTRTADARNRAIELVRNTKLLWQDRGSGFSGLLEILCPEDWEITQYGLKTEDGYVLPER